MFSRLKRQLAIFAPLSAGLLIITLLTVLGGLWQYGQELMSSQTAAKPSVAAIKLVAAQEKSKTTGPAPKTGAVAVITGSTPAGTAGSQASGTDAGSPAQPAGKTAAGPKTAKAAGVPVSTIALSLSINGYFEGQVRLAAGSNQCDVLSQAYAEGVISSLNMRYDSQFGTEGVYVIDGMGDPDTVWWTYKVNGTAPPYGCGYVTAHSGDSVNWQYIK